MFVLLFFCSLWWDVALSSEEDISKLREELPALVERLVLSPGPDTTDLLFSEFEPNAGVFWVDWGDEEFYIIEGCARALGFNNLAEEPDASEPPRLIITYKDKRHEFPKDMTPTAQFTTLVRLNEVLSSEYEIRMIWDSDGGDTLAFVVLGVGCWKRIEKAFGKNVVNKAFFQFTEETDIFGGDISTYRP